VRIDQDDEGTIWIFTLPGLAKVRNGKVEVVRYIDGEPVTGFACPSAHNIVADRNSMQAIREISARATTNCGPPASCWRIRRVTERERISRELHDTLGHHLTALSLNLEVASHLARDLPIRVLMPGGRRPALDICRGCRPLASLAGGTEHRPDGVSGCELRMSLRDPIFQFDKGLSSGSTGSVGVLLA
jgi:hypothetical protein